MTKDKVVIVGLGGAAGNFINNLSARGDVEYKMIAINSDANALDHALTDTTICLQDNSLNPHGLGAKGNPEIGRALAETCLEKVMSYLLEFQTILFVAGLGGGTGTGTMPVFASEAIKLGKNVICISYIPFTFEGKDRVAHAEKALFNMEKSGVSVFTINNQDLFNLANEKTTFADAFRMADDAIYNLFKELESVDFDKTRLNSKQIKLMG